MDANTNLISPEENPQRTINAYKLGSDMKWTAIYIIIIGALSCVGIVTALIGIPMIIVGLRMNEAARAFQDYSQSQDQNALAYAIEHQGKSFAILKILIIAYIILTIISIILTFAVFIPNMSNMYNF